jgi:hypothetical protein
MQTPANPTPTPQARAFYGFQIAIENIHSGGGLGSGPCVRRFGANN